MGSQGETTQNQKNNNEKGKYNYWESKTLSNARIHTGLGDVGV